MGVSEKRMITICGPLSRDQQVTAGLMRAILTTFVMPTSVPVNGAGILEPLIEPDGDFLA